VRARVELKLDGVEPLAQLGWVVLAEQVREHVMTDLSLAVDPAGLDERVMREIQAGHALAGVELLSGKCDLSADGEFVFVSSARGLHPGMFERPGTVVIAPSGFPDQLDQHLYWLLCAPGRYAGRLKQCAERICATPALDRLDEYLEAMAPAACLTSLVTSVFSGDRFLDGFLANMAGLEDYGNCQHLLIRPGSPGQEHDALLAHARRWPGVVYLNLKEDPGLYETWNLACCLARGRYLSNANVDDVRHRSHVRRLRQLLERTPPADVASSALRVTGVANQRWSDWRPGKTFYGDGEEEVYEANALIARKPDGSLRPHNRPHCMPLWRRLLHLFFGFFNEKEYGPSADWEFWLRCGAAGSRFVRTPVALGLYLKHGASYWHRDGNQDFERRILRRYAGLVHAGVCLQDAAAPPWHDLSRFVATRHWLGVLICLLRLEAARGPGADESGSKPGVADQWARRYFGVGLAVVEFDAACPGGAVQRLERLSPVLIDMLREFCKAGIADTPERTQQARRWHELLVNWHLASGDLAPLVGLAWMARALEGGAEIEQRILRALHGMDPLGFWPAVQRVYRHEVSLEELNRTVEACPVATGPGNRGDRQTRIWYFPTFSNDYQKLLYRQPRREGCLIEGVRSLEELAALQPDPARNSILHLHWLNAVFEGAGVDFESRSRELLELVENRQAMGFEVYWTVHNRLNHETGHPDLEAQLRRKLARLVDRVYIHHPMVRWQLDWWPEDVAPWLCEHGPYETNPGAISRDDAREQLGMAKDARVFLWFGQIRPYKGLDAWLPVILETLAGLSRARLIIAGKAPVPDARPRFGAASSRVKFIDRFVPDDELQLLADAADFGILTYRDILTSGAMFHLFSMGLPVIAPEKGTLPGYVIPGWNGALYGDREGLIDALQAACRLDASTLQQRRAAASATSLRLRWGRVV